MISDVEASSQDLEITRNHFQPSTSTAFRANGFSSNTPIPTTSGQPNINGNYTGYDATFLSEFANFEATMASWSNPGFDWDFTNASGPLPLAADVEKWNVSDSAFLQALELCRTTTKKDPVLDPDVPVKAILWGWHTVDAAQRQHPVWQALKQVDERVFGAWTNKAQRIAMMYVCQLGLQVSTESAPHIFPAMLMISVPRLAHKREPASSAPMVPALPITRTHRPPSSDRLSYLAWPP